MEKMMSPLFRGVTEKELADMRSRGCLRETGCRKGGIIFRTGEVTNLLGIVVSGSVNVENIDLWGNRRILSNIAPGESFGETYAVTGETLMVDAAAAEDSRILLVDAAGIIRRETYADLSWSGKISRNLLMISAGKNLMLSSRILQSSFKRSRPRIMSYLSSVSVRTGSLAFDIPFDRQALADYLNLDRSALSKELCRMRDEGLIEFRKNHFRLLSQHENPPLADR